MIQIATKAGNLLANLSKLMDCAIVITYADALLARSTMLIFIRGKGAANVVYL